MTLRLESPAFQAGADIPRKYTCDGENVSPPLHWSGVPPEAASLILACNDPDAPGGVFHHWAAWNLPIDWTGLEEGYGPETLDEGFRQAINDFRKPGYAGPCPPKGDRPHAYHFRLCALREPILSAATSVSCKEIERLAAPLEIVCAELVGYYGR